MLSPTITCTNCRLHFRTTVTREPATGQSIRCLFKRKYYRINVTKDLTHQTALLNPLDIELSILKDGLGGGFAGGEGGSARELLRISSNIINDGSLGLALGEQECKCDFES